MLVLSRKTDQTAVARLPDGREIVVKVIEIRNGTVRLGFEADRDITIDRREVHDAKQQGLPTMLVTTAGG